MVQSCSPSSDEDAQAMLPFDFRCSNDGLLSASPASRNRTEGAAGAFASLDNSRTPAVAATILNFGSVFPAATMLQYRQQL